MTISKAHLLHETENAYARGQVDGFRAGCKAEASRLATEYSQAKLAQVQAASKLLEEAGRMLSRAGYMVGKINGDNQR